MWSIYTHVCYIHTAVCVTLQNIFTIVVPWGGRLQWQLQCFAKGFTVNTNQSPSTRGATWSQWMSRNNYWWLLHLAWAFCEWHWINGIIADRVGSLYWPLNGFLYFTSLGCILQPDCLPGLTPLQLTSSGSVCLPLLSGHLICNHSLIHQLVDGKKIIGNFDN